VLFTDVEGSTRLIEKLGEEGYAQALAEHRKILRGFFPSTAASRSTRRGMRSCTRSPILTQAGDAPASYSSEANVPPQGVVHYPLGDRRQSRLFLRRVCGLDRRLQDLVSRCPRKP
jgi:hypothetical protein